MTPEQRTAWNKVFARTSWPARRAPLRKVVPQIMEGNIVDQTPFRVVGFRPKRSPGSIRAEIYSNDPVFGTSWSTKVASKLRKPREHCVKYMSEIRIDRKFCSCRAVFHVWSCEGGGVKIG
jgi:hypothetical protein